MIVALSQAWQGGGRELSRIFRWFIILFVAIFLLSIAGAAIAALISPEAGAIVLSLGWGILALLAIWDGVSRLAGHRALLGSPTRLGQVLAVLQIVLGVAVLISVLSGVPAAVAPGILGLMQ